jgi:AmmeMemoRadiSam system protein B
MGDIALNGVLREALLSSSRIFRADRLAHLHEHSIEVQLPFLQVLQQGFRFVPIVVASTDIDELRRAGTDIARTVKSLGLSGNLTLIASSDMTHYESHETAKRKDAQAIEAVLDLDEELLLKRVREMDISMCGASPTAVMIVAAKALGAKKGSLVRYQTSGDTSGDYSSVVGYAGIIIK